MAELESAAMFGPVPPQVLFQAGGAAAQDASCTLYQQFDRAAGLWRLKLRLAGAGQRDVLVAARPQPFSARALRQEPGMARRLQAAMQAGARARPASAAGPDPDDPELPAMPGNPLWPDLDAWLAGGIGPNGPGPAPGAVPPGLYPAHIPSIVGPSMAGQPVAAPADAAPSAVTRDVGREVWAEARGAEHLGDVPARPLQARKPEGPGTPSAGTPGGEVPHSVLASSPHGGADPAQQEVVAASVPALTTSVPLPADPSDARPALAILHSLVAAQATPGPGAASGALRARPFKSVPSPVRQQMPFWALEPSDDPDAKAPAGDDPGQGRAGALGIGWQPPSLTERLNSGADGSEAGTSQLEAFADEGAGNSRADAARQAGSKEAQPSQQAGKPAGTYRGGQPQGSAPDATPLGWAAPSQGGAASGTHGGGSKILGKLPGSTAKPRQAAEQGERGRDGMGRGAWGLAPPPLAVLSPDSQEAASLLRRAADAHASLLTPDGWPTEAAAVRAAARLLLSLDTMARAEGAVLEACAEVRLNTRLPVMRYAVVGPAPAVARPPHASAQALVRLRPHPRARMPWGPSLDEAADLLAFIGAGLACLERSYAIEQCFTPGGSIPLLTCLEPAAEALLCDDVAALASGILSGRVQAARGVRLRYVRLPGQPPQCPAPINLIGPEGWGRSRLCLPAESITMVHQDDMG